MSAMQGVTGGRRGTKRKSAGYAFSKKKGSKKSRSAASITAGMGDELKFHDVNLDDAAVAAAGTVTDSVVKIAQGTGQSQRDGRKCVIAKIGWRYRLTLPEYVNQPTPSPGDVVRMLMYVDKQANGATATVLDILAAASYQSFNNLSNKSRFYTLMDKTITMNYQTLAGVTGAVDGAVEVYEGSFYKNCDVPLEFSDTLGAITEIRSNNIGVLLISAFGVATFNSKLRFRFVG